jgi:sec-independent protein translocase protein TatA
MWELILIFAIVVLLFGARRLPEIAKGLGKGIREFRRALSGDMRDETRLPGVEEKKNDEPSSGNGDR